MSIPQPGITYRIQNVDFDTCIELWDADEELVALRPFKDTELQQWTFVKDPGSRDRYKILATMSQTLPYPVHLGIAPAKTPAVAKTAPIPPIAIMEDTGVALWRVQKEADGSFAITTNGKDSRHETVLKVADNGMLDTSEEKISNNRNINRSMRWKIVEYWPAVPKDKYRIRTLNGAALDISPSLDQFSVEAVRKDYRQEWLVEPKGNGKCYISMRPDNHRDHVYLGWERGKDGIAQIAASRVPVEWIVKLLSEYTYSITFYHSVSDQSSIKLALSVTDDEVHLKPRKVAHNQIWFFEVVDAFSASDSPRSGGTNKRYDEIGQGTWIPQNMQSGQYAHFYGSSPQWVYCQSASKSNKTYITYLNNGNTFIMAHESSTTKCLRYAGGVVDVIDGTANATAWVLDRQVDPAGGFVYYICPAFDRTQCISGETTTGLANMQIFKVVTKKLGVRSQQWKFFSQ